MTKALLVGALVLGGAVGAVAQQNNATNMAFFQPSKGAGRYLGYVQGGIFRTCLGNTLKIAEYKNAVWTKTSAMCSKPQLSPGAQIDDYDSDTDLAKEARDKELKARDKELKEIQALPKNR